MLRRCLHIYIQCITKHVNEYRLSFPKNDEYINNLNTAHLRNHGKLNNYSTPPAIAVICRIHHSVLNSMHTNVYYNTSINLEAD